MATSYSLIQIEISAEEISKDQNLINALKPSDAHTVGFVTANEQVKYDLQHAH